MSNEHSVEMDTQDKNAAGKAIEDFTKENADLYDDDDDLDSTNPLVIDTGSENDFQDSGSDWNPETEESSDEENSTSGKLNLPPKGSFIHPRTRPHSSSTSAFEKAAERIRFSMGEIEFNTKPVKTSPSISISQGTQTDLSDEALRYSRAFADRQRVHSYSMLCLVKNSHNIEKQFGFLNKLNQKLTMIHDRCGVPFGASNNMTPPPINESNDGNQSVPEKSPIKSLKRSPEKSSEKSPKKDNNAAELMSDDNTTLQVGEASAVKSSTVVPPVPLANCADMIPIGSGRTEIPRHVYNQIKWNSYTSATRKLLMAVFPRITLATHSLTGKSSPAFSDRAPKMKLDTRKVNDIIMVVSQVCGAKENLVRNTITTKCSDENKMYRMRLKKMVNLKKCKGRND